MRHASIRMFLVSSLMTVSYGVVVPALDSGSTGVASASTIAACQGNDFWGGWVGRNGATGTLIYNVAFINDGQASCRLSGFPTVQGYKNGREYPLTAGHIKGPAFAIYPTVVAPRMSAVMVITTMDDCNALNSGDQTEIKKVIAKNTYPEMSVKFPNSNYPINVYGLVLDVACGLNVTRVGWR
jgi:hypothetical protein